MSWPAPCPGCMMGDHTRHNPSWNVQEGLIGGNTCDCTGDCAEQRKAEFDEMWGPIVHTVNGGSP